MDHFTKAINEQTSRLEIYWAFATKAPIVANYRK